MGIGSATAKKVLIRVDGPSLRSEDDVLLERKRSARWQMSAASRRRDPGPRSGSSPETSSSAG